MRYESNACKKNGSRGSMILVTQSKHIHVLCKEGIHVLILYLDWRFWSNKILRTLYKINNMVNV